MKPLASRLSNFQESVIREMTRKAIEHDAVNLSQGMPDFNPPEELINGIEKAIALQEHQYSITYGREDLREKIAEKLSIYNKINYNPEEFMKLSGFSGPFILYSSVRIKSILRKFEIEKELSEEEFLGLEKQKEEIDLIKKMMLFPEVVESAQKQIAPHLICRYLYELSQKFNLFYGKCSIQKAQSEELKTMRLMLAKNVEQILVTGLWTLGIEAPEKM